MGGQTVTLDIDGNTFSVVINEKEAPLAAKAFVRQLPLDGTIVHAMWSGPLFLMGGINLDDSPRENEITFVGLGDITYHPSHYQIGISYATSQWREPVGSVYVTGLGHLEGDLAPLAEIGRTLQRTGARKFVFR